MRRRVTYFLSIDRDESDTLECQSAMLLSDLNLLYPDGDIALRPIAIDLVVRADNAPPQGGLE